MTGRNLFKCKFHVSVATETPINITQSEATREGQAEEEEDCGR